MDLLQKKHPDIKIADRMDPTEAVKMYVTPPSCACSISSSVVHMHVRRVLPKVLQIGSEHKVTNKVHVTEVSKGYEKLTKYSCTQIASEHKIQKTNEVQLYVYD